MSNTFCTIITAGYYPKALALFKSIRKFDTDLMLQVLIADNKPLPENLPLPSGIKLIPVSDLYGYSLVDDLYNKYAHIDMDSFRWSLKSMFISYLLETGTEKLLYVDCDMFL